MTLGRVLYLLGASLLTGLYAFGEGVGWEDDDVERQAIPQSVRQSPGGWRSYSFWHTGIHGGK